MKSILLIGLGRFGKHIAMELSKLGCEIMAIDHNEDRLNEALPYITNGQIGDSTQENFLSALDVPSFDVCIVTISNDFQSSLETTSLLKELGGQMVVSRAEQDRQAKFLLRNGADEIVYPEKQLAKWIAVRYSTNHILDYIPLDDENAIFEVDLPDTWIGKTVGQIDVRKRYGIIIMGVRKNGDLQLFVTTETLFSHHDTILVMGNTEKFQKYFQSHID